jgi:PadR family transcriptional regulator PadR
VALCTGVLAGGKWAGADPAVWRYGYDLCQQLGLKAGSMYPILMRLADRELLTTA